ncbi:MAG: J domain-containing protein [Candidatus Poribacteria bacterium]|nr:J domain-containing protein [Candidatus Poribacteria bacterium]MDE0505355.1 J domain-containing protein [Candidatus Poribacteria bacterium]
MTRAEALRILGLEPDATPIEVKRAYRQLVIAVHPDKNPAPNARHLFQLVQEAYEFISTIEQQEHAREARDRAERQAKARTAREKAEREARRKEERERAERDARDRAERQAKARAARERAEREAKQKEERERANRERLEREVKEKAAQETEAQREWERQREEAAKMGFGGCFVGLILLIMTIPTCIAFNRLMHMIGLGGEAFFSVMSIAVPAIIYGALWLGSTINELMKKHQLREFDENHPMPSKGKTVPKEVEAQKEWERQRAEAAELGWGRGFVVLVPFIMIIPTCIVFYRLMRMIGLGGGAIFGVMIIAVPAIMFGALWLGGTISELIEKHQLRKFDKNHPTPSKGKTEEATDETA